MARTAATALVVLLAAIGAAGASRQTARPLFGAMYSHLSCGLDHAGLVAELQNENSRQLMRAQLAAMRDAGLESLRIIVWNMHDASPQTWGVVSSAGGTISEPARSNLIRYLSDVRAAGFQRLTLAFSPQWTNNPIGEWGPTGLEQDRWDAAMLDENWGFVAAVRKLAKEYGPPTTRFDLLQEIPPSSYMPPFIVTRLESYIATFWTRYAQEFGTTEDASFSTILKGDASGIDDRLDNLLAALASTGLAYPRWFEVHTDWSSPATLEELQVVDRTLSAHGLSQPIVVGESAYENQAVANDVARFAATSSRPVEEVYQWWNEAEGFACVSPPYRADAYYRAFTGTAPPVHTQPPPPEPTLVAEVKAAGAVTLSLGGRAVGVLDAATYRVVVVDRSTRFGLRLTVGRTRIATTPRFRGRKTDTYDIGTDRPYGSTFTVASVPAGRSRVVVLH
jgi:hypothetical protein